MTSSPAFSRLYSLPNNFDVCELYPLSTIITFITGYGDKSWGTSSLLMLIDSTAYAELNQDEKRNIDKGNILVNRDPITGKIIIRVWTRNKQSLADVLDSSDFR